MSAAKQKSKPLPEFRNAKASRDYEIGQRFEAGLMLRGTEIKSVRAGQVNISDAFVRFERGVPMLYHAHIAEYGYGNANNHRPYAQRKLLLHTREIHKILGEIRSGGRAVIPLRLYFKGSLLKCEIAVCTGKDKGDKRQDLKRKADERDIRQAMSPRR